MGWTDTESAEDMDMDMDKARRESPVGVAASWMALVASFALSFATWVALAELAGFDQRVTVAGHSAALAWMMPLAVDGYVITALVAWMAPVSDEVARFAKWNTYAAAGIGVVAQSSYHGLSADTSGGRTWVAVLAAAVGALPPLASALSVHLRALVRRAGHVRADAAVSTDKPSTADTDTVWTRTPEPTVQPDTSALFVPDSLDTPAPVDIVDRVPAPRRPRPASGWKVSALDMIRTGEPATDREIAEKILADAPETWATVEAGRKAVSRLRSAA